MVSFFISLVLLLVLSTLYGKYVERVFSPSDRPTPAVAMADGVDYVPMPTWKVFMIQFLNIAGTGPIFGAIMGAWYGPSAYYWIVFGCVFGGAVHDYFSGMLSVRHAGANQPELVGIYLGRAARRVLLVFAVLLLVMVGVVFVYTPALILQHYCWDTLVWVLVIFTYYILATMLPIDKVIGRFYPIFAFALLFMAVALMAVLVVKTPSLPEWWSDLPAANLNSPASLLGTDSFLAKNPLFPCLFITIACGAVSGFHATQSPLMARCMRSEAKGRHIFYGAMVIEGMVALVWAALSSYFFYSGGWREIVDAQVANDFLAQVGTADGKSLIQYFTAPSMVRHICTGWLGVLGGVLAIFGVVAAPITSGDTAFRSARLIIADALHVSQHTLTRRFAIALPMFFAAILLLVWQMSNPDGFNTIWQWFGWSNQTLAVITLWTVTVYLVRERKPYWIAGIPALFMTAVCSTYLFVSRQALGLDPSAGYVCGLLCTLAAAVWFAVWKRKTV